MKMARRHFLALLSGALHAGLLALLLSTPRLPGEMRDDEAGAFAVSLFQGPPAARPATSAAPAAVNDAPASEAAADAEPQAPADVPPIFADVERSSPAEPSPLTADSVSLSVAAASAGAAGEACHMTAWLQKALQDDPRVREALPLIPRRSRSIANAVMLWDGDWVELPTRGEDRLSTLRNMVISGVSAAPAACQEELIRGPELIALMDPSGAVLLALGSGQWRWADLLPSKSAE